jgi:hypothetical protein
MGIRRQRFEIAGKIHPVDGRRAAESKNSKDGPRIAEK